MIRTHSLKFLILATLFILAFSMKKTVHTEATSQNQKTNPDSDIDILKRNTVLLVLQKLSVTPSYSLCFQLGMQKCDNKCCDENWVSPASHLTMRQYHDEQQNKESKETQDQKKAEEEKGKVFNQSQLCEMTSRIMCGENCCISEGCEQNEKEGENLQVEDPACKIPDPSTQDLCRGAGLLWCDGACCGFNSGTHKCFRKNHYGIPYVRCPIEAPVFVAQQQKTE